MVALAVLLPAQAHGASDLPTAADQRQPPSKVSNQQTRLSRRQLPSKTSNQQTRRKMPKRPSSRRLAESIRACSPAPFPGRLLILLTTDTEMLVERQDGG